MKEYKRIDEIDFGQYDAANYTDISGKELFNKMFLYDEKIQDILKNNKYFLLGDKGTGKTAYSVYISNNRINDTDAFIISMDQTEYEKFVTLKEKRDLDLSGYTDIWKVILLLLISDKIRKTEKQGILSGIQFQNLERAIDEFYYYAFTPEVKYAMQFVEQSKESAEIVYKAIQAGGSHAGKITFEETRFQNNLMYIEKQFIDALQEVPIKRKYILFMDGIDIRPETINFDEYIKCVKGLAQATWELNTSILQSTDKLRRIKVMLLVRPDIFDQMGLHNMNNRLNDNCVILEWKTTYRDFMNSGLFKIADRLFSSQQDETLKNNIKCGEAWNHYFPYKVYNYREGEKTDSSFIPFLRYSFYRPRDILAYLAILKKHCNNEKEVFEERDFKNSQVQRGYANYLLGEIRDNLSFYHPASDFEIFRNFFQYLKKYVNEYSREFEYDDFVCAYDEYIQHLKKADGFQTPLIFQSVDYVLQLLFELNIIAYIDNTRNDLKYQRWYFKERSHANIRPRVRTNTVYKMHRGIAQALYVVL